MSAAERIKQSIQDTRVRGPGRETANAWPLPVEVSDLQQLLHQVEVTDKIENILDNCTDIIVSGASNYGSITIELDGIQGHAKVNELKKLIYELMDWSPVE